MALVISAWLGPLHANLSSIAWHLNYSTRSSLMDIPMQWPFKCVESKLYRIHVVARCITLHTRLISVYQSVGAYTLKCIVTAIYSNCNARHCNARIKAIVRLLNPSEWFNCRAFLPINFIEMFHWIECMWGGSRGHAVDNVANVDVSTKWKKVGMGKKCRRRQEHDT